jgi:hypothetical protein
MIGCTTCLQRVGTACLGLMFVLLVQCSGRSRSETSYNGKSEAGSPAVGGAGAVGGSEASGGNGAVVGSSAGINGTAGTEPVGGGVAGTVGIGGTSGSGGSVAGTAGVPDVPVNPCASGTGHMCGSPCMQCNTLDGSCYVGTCDFLGDCTANDPQCESNATRSCAPTDADGANDAEGNECNDFLGWGWDGSKCIAVVGCRCVGSECGSLLHDEFTCVVVYTKDAGCGS